MTIAEFNKYNVIKSMPCFDIGQGYGYKADEIPANHDDIIYIPEYGYADNGTVKRDNAYSFNDLLDITGSEAKAAYLFEYIDWQFPETAHEEIEY